MKLNLCLNSNLIIFTLGINVSFLFFEMETLNAEKAFEAKILLLHKIPKQVRNDRLAKDCRGKPGDALDCFVPRNDECAETPKN